MDTYRQSVDDRLDERDGVEAAARVCGTGSANHDQKSSAAHSEYKDTYQSLARGARTVVSL